MRKPRRSSSPARQPGPTDQGRTSEPNESSVFLEHGAFLKGPLPPPAILEDFQRIVPDAPERILRQWELEADHRRAYERTALDATVRREALGQISAVLFALTALGVSAFAIWMHEPWVAATIGGGTIVSVVGAFLYRRSVKRVDTPAPLPPP